MENRRQAIPGERPAYFELQADIGITKHMGGRRATRELVGMCRLREGQVLLEVGCGVGGTACSLAQEVRCRVVGVDISEGMVARARARAKRRGLEAAVEFRVADAQDLPFDGDLFDAVVDESVLAFVADKQRAIGEYGRVVKPGGTVGLNEATWMQSPSPEVVKYVSFIMANADFLTAGGWEGLLAGSGLVDLEVRSYKFEARSQFAEELRQLDMREYLGAWYRFLTQSLTNAAYRRFAWEVLRTPSSIFQFMKCIGYGLYVGRKQAG
jgi:arsenite methyltransferase